MADKPNVVQLSELPRMQIRVTDDEDALRAFEQAGPDYQGPMVMTHEDYDALQAAASKAGQTVPVYFRQVVRGMSRGGSLG
jgi:hypothetical protein